MYEETTTLPPEASAIAITCAPPVVVPYGVLELRRLADMIGASSFSLFVAGPMAAASRLVPVFDCQFPGISVLSRRLSSREGIALADMAIDSVGPIWWSPDDGKIAGLGDPGWIRRIAPPAGLASRGLLLPVQSECGRVGVVVFSGENLDMSTTNFSQLHWECFAIFAKVAPTRPLASSRAPTMSKRELECLKLTANGLTSEEIARDLGLSVHTANQYLTNTSQKLNAMNRIHAVAKALRGGLID